MDFTFGTRMQDNGSRERLAWAVLLASFGVWLALVIAVPVGVSSFVRNATRPLTLLVQANEGTVGITAGNGQRDAIFVGEPARTVEGRASILTSATDTALVSVFPPGDTETVLSRLQVYGSTGLDVEEANAPRFNLSDDTYELELSLNSGRLRISLPERNGRPVAVRILTPQQGEVVLENAGQYSLLATNAATSVVVLEGSALVEAGEQQMALGTNERAVVPVEGPLSGPLSSERELLSNGDFSENLEGWTPSAWEVDLADQEAGTTAVVNAGGEQVLRFQRVGQGHADAELRQVISQDVTDYQSLELFVTMRIVNQSLGVCGIQGSECPLFVRLTYEDRSGSEQTWQQGFFATGEIAAGSTPDVCQFCAAPRNPHLRVPLDQIYFYESGNLLERLAQQNIAPRIIKSISLAASGHTFETHVVDVSLIAVE